MTKCIPVFLEPINYTFNNKKEKKNTNWIDLVNDLMSPSMINHNLIFFFKVVTIFNV